MQKSHRVSLNAIRVFATVARTGSLAASGKALFVTASAVSHQLKNLESELGVDLLRRGNNTVALTEAGTRFYEEVAPAIALIERSTDTLRRDETEVSVQASTSLALRWLIPSLEGFRAACPEARVRVETGPVKGALTAPFCDVAIRYFRNEADSEGWQLLIPDACRPVVAPRLLVRGAKQGKAAISKIPAIQSAAGNWNWKRWGSECGVPMSDIHFSHAFDTDDAALHACVAGLGLVLAPPILTTKEIDAGLLTELPGFSPVTVGAYRFQRRSESRAVRQFCEWMEDEIRSVA